jgi:hypothetical protein
VQRRLSEAYRASKFRVDMHRVRRTVNPEEKGLTGESFVINNKIVLSFWRLLQGSIASIRFDSISTERSHHGHTVQIISKFFFSLFVDSVGREAADENATLSRPLVDKIDILALNVIVSVDFDSVLHHVEVFFGLENALAREGREVFVIE